MRCWLLSLAALSMAAACSTQPPSLAAPGGGGELTTIGGDTPSDVPDVIRYTTARSALAKGKRLTYTVEIHEHVLRSLAGQAQASETTFSYLLKGAPNPVSRPVIFVYNGGPGSSSIWQHLGFYGPRRIKLTDAVHPPITPPFELEDNPHTLLDIADIVFIDPVGTGYSRLLKADAGKSYFGVDQDAVAIAEAMEAWLTRHQRWNSPKFIAGESYGTTRSAMLARNLMGGPLSLIGRMTGITLNGIIVLGPAMSGGGTDTTPRGLGSLPSAAATAWHFRRAGQGERLEAFMARVSAFVRDEYAPALADANLSPERHAAIAEKVAAFTGLPRDLIDASNLQPGLDLVRANLLKDQGLRLGSYDSRYTLPIHEGIGPPDPVTDDPAMGQYTPSFVGAFQLYMNELGLAVQRPYDAIAWETVNFKWDYTPVGRGPKTPKESFIAAMNRNADLGMFIGVGWYDFVTTAAGADAMVKALGFGQDRVTLRQYPSGHMPYLGEESATQLEADIRAFIANQTRQASGG